MTKKIVSVYGYGRFGKLWADILKKDFRVKVYSRRGLKPEDIYPGIEISDLEGLHETDALFYCIAISSLEAVLTETKQLHRSNCIYFDTCSVKVEPVRWMKQHLPENSQIIATHPMFGPDSYDAATDLLPMVMCNISASDANFSYWKDYFNNDKIQVEVMTPDEHDEMVAYSQGITHYIGRVLADLNLKNTQINTLGYQKLLEIIQQTCNDSWQLFCDLQHFNPYTKKMRKDLHESIEKIYTILNKL
ncbi:MAG TPA: prephenate dehydrogenase/arogenate dehydrogenase family protein [Bacteroidales bacterium]|nr:prephenate dehydrogenase/arogenate dehydrogenase family protein [Bacteroidales bacterium]